MSDSFELKLNSPLTKEDWNKICDVELEHTKKITYKTPSGKEVVFISLAELEEIKAEMEDKLEPFILGERNLKKDALQILDNHIKKEG